jgi:hypothetical protein
MYREFKDNTEVIVADSVGELVDAVTVGREKHDEPFGHDVCDSSWLGRRFDDWTDVVEATRSPWDDGLQVVDRMVSALNDARLPKPVSRRRKTRFAEDAGDEIDNDRLRDGRDYWRRCERQNISGPATITVIADMRAACSVNHRDILWRGAAAVALTYLLEEAGYRVELWAAQAEKDAFSGRERKKGTDMFVAVCLKRPSDPVDLGALVAGVSAWFYRLIGFGAANIVRNRKPTPYAGFDRPGGVNPFLDTITRDEHRVVVEGVWSEEAACEFIRGVLDAISKR